MRSSALNSVCTISRCTASSRERSSSCDHPAPSSDRSTRRIGRSYSQYRRAPNANCDTTDGRRRMRTELLL